MRDTRQEDQSRSGKNFDGMLSQLSIGSISSGTTHHVLDRPKRSTGTDGLTVYALAMRPKRTDSLIPTHPFIKFGASMRWPDSARPPVSSLWPHRGPSRQWHIRHIEVPQTLGCYLCLHPRAVLPSMLWVAVAIASS
jgi:hypothetical protein